MKATVNGTTTVYIGNYYEQTGSAIRKYYYAGGQRVAMRENSTVYYLLTDHLGSTAITANSSGNRVAELRYKAWGETRYTYGTTPTTYCFTGQREDATIGLYFYNARYYHPALGRFISADPMVPEPGNPQALNRYAYVYNNPLRYTDSTGHLPWWAYVAGVAGLYIVGRAGYEVGTLIVPGADQARRDQIGGSLVTEFADVIERESAARSVDPRLVSAVLRHESAAFERRLLTLWPTMQPGLIANTAEFAQSVLQGDAASIGPGQMQLRRARELEEMGYVTPRRNDFERRLALLNNQTAVEYVAGMLQYVSDQLRSIQGYNDLEFEQQQRLILIAYNWGWTEEFQKHLRDRGFIEMIERAGYDNQTLDEYLRWRENR